MNSPSRTDRSAYRSTVWFQAALLGGATLVTTSLLSLGDLATRDDIALRAEEDLRASIGQVVPAAIHDNNLVEDQRTERFDDGGTITVYRATRDGIPTALAYTVAGPGYSGTIRAIMGVDPQGRILGVRVLAHTETPGLGDKIEVLKDDWILGFDGRSLGDPPAAEWGVKKDGGHFDQFTGATITPRAVVKAVRSGLEFFDRRGQALLAGDVDGSDPAPATTRGDR